MASTKRDTLLDTAERLFYEAGFHATGIDRVVSEAGVARMTLYNHFPSKEALVEAVLERRYRRYLDDLQHAVAQAPDGSCTATLMERHCHWLATVSDRGCIVLKAIAEFEQHHPPIAEQGRRLKDELLRLIRDALARDGRGDVDELAGRLLIVLEGSDATVPLLGPDAAMRHARALAAGLLNG